MYGIPVIYGNIISHEYLTRSGRFRKPRSLGWMQPVLGTRYRVHGGKLFGTGKYVRYVIYQYFTI